MTHDETLIFVRTLERFGGGFCAALGDAWIKADSHNRNRLAAAFPDLIKDYGPGSTGYREEYRRYFLKESE